jgi:hypothetical protein
LNPYRFPYPLTWNLQRSRHDATRPIINDLPRPLHDGPVRNPDRSNVHSGQLPVSPEERRVKESEITLPVAAAPSSSTSSSSETSSNSSKAAIASTDAASSSTSSSSTSSPSSKSFASPVPPPKPPDLNHFYPRDPTLAPGLQDPNRMAGPLPDQAELDRRNRRFDRVHGFRRDGGGNGWGWRRERQTQEGGLGLKPK